VLDFALAIDTPGQCGFGGWCRVSQVPR